MASNSEEVLKLSDQYVALELNYLFSYKDPDEQLCLPNFQPRHRYNTHSKIVSICEKKMFSVVSFCLELDHVTINSDTIGQSQLTWASTSLPPSQALALLPSSCRKSSGVASPDMVNFVQLGPHHTCSNWVIVQHRMSESK